MFERPVLGNGPMQDGIRQHHPQSLYSQIWTWMSALMKCQNKQSARSCLCVSPLWPGLWQRHVDIVWFSTTSPNQHEGRKQHQWGWFDQNPKPLQILRTSPASSHCRRQACTDTAYGKWPVGNSSAMGVKNLAFKTLFQHLIIYVSLGKNLTSWESWVFNL